MNAFCVSRTVRFGHCDPSGIAYFPSYLDILNGVVEEFWDSLGFPMGTLILRWKIGLPTVHIDCDFRIPSRFGDRLQFVVNVRRVGRSSLDLEHVVSGSDGIRWRSRQTIVATSIADHRAIPWPPDLRAALVERVNPDPTAL